MNHLSKITRLYPLITSIVFLSSCTMLRQMTEFKEERYETGKFKGAESCRKCHTDIYEQWKTSQHAGATQNDWFIELKDRLPLMPKLMIGDKPCYACHGPENLNEGVTCEVCHGINDQDDVMKVHRQKYTPNLVNVRKAGFCGKCHYVVNPMSGATLMTTLDEWQKSQAAREGRQCSDCHMNNSQSEQAFHGFSSKLHDVMIYEDDFAVKNIKLNFPDLIIDVENKIQGHFLPTGGPEPVLLLDVNLQDDARKIVYSIQEEFNATFSVFMGMPFKSLSDSRLKNGEIRTLSFTLPEQLKGRISIAEVSAKFLDVDFIHKGDVKKARWESVNFYEKTFTLDKTK